MAFLKITKNYSDILDILNTPLSAALKGLKILDLYLKDDESSVVLLTGFTLFIFCLSLLNCHILQEYTRLNNHNDLI